MRILGKKTALILIGLLAVVLGRLVPAQATRLVGIDEARDRIVSIAIPSGQAETILGGPDVRADEVLWSPDESFAYLIDRKRDRLLVYDPILEDVTRVIELEQVLDVKFSASGETAFVAGCEIVALDTATHEIVDILPVRGERGWRDEVYPWAIDDERVYSIVDRGTLTIVDLERHTLRTAHIDLFLEDVVGLALGDDGGSLYVATSRHVLIHDRGTARETGRLYFRGPIQEISAVPGSDRLVVVTRDDIVLVRQSDPNDRIFIECSGWPHSHCYEGSTEVSSGGGTVLEWGYWNRMRALSTDDASLIWEAWNLYEWGNFYLRGLSRDGRTALLSHRDGSVLVRDGSVIAELEGDQFYGSLAWRETDRSFYTLSGVDLVRIDGVRGERHTLIEGYGFADLAVFRDTSRALFLLEKRDAIFSVDLTNREVSLVETPAPNGDRRRFSLLTTLPYGRAVVYSYESYETQDILIIDGDEATPIGLDQPLHLGQIAPLSPDSLVGIGETAMVVVELDDEPVVEIQSVQETYWWVNGWIGVDSRPDLGVAYGAWTVEGSNRYRTSVRRLRRDGGIDARWDGPFGWTAVDVAAADGSRFFLAVGTGGSAGASGHEIVLIDIDTESVLSRTPVHGRVTSMRYSPQPGLLYVELAGEAGLVVLDDAGRVLGGVPDQSTLEQLELVETEAAPVAGLAPVAELSSRIPDGSFVAFVYEDGEVVTATSSGVASLVFDNLIRDGRVMSTTPDGKILLGARRDSRAVLIELDVAEGLSLRREIDLPGAPEDIAVSRDGETIFVLLAGGDVAVVDSGSGMHLHTIPAGTDSARLAVTHDGDLLVWGYREGLTLIEGATGSVTKLSSDLGVPVPVAGGVLFSTTAADGARIWRQDSEWSQPAESTIVPRLGRLELFASGDGNLVLAPAGCCGCADGVFVLDPKSARVERQVDLAGSHGLFGLDFTGDHAYLRAGDSIVVADTGGGGLVASVALTTDERGVQRYLETSVVGCLNCRVAIDRPRPSWTRLPTVTPTRTPVPTPTMEYPPWVDEEGIWFTIEDAYGFAGEVVEVKVRPRMSWDDRVQAVQMDLRFPDELQPVEWRDRLPDCEYDWEWENDLRPGPSTRFELLPPGCDPSRDCSGIRAVVSGYLESMMFRCRFRIRDDAAPGVYTIDGDNLLVQAESRVRRLQIVPGNVAVRGDEDDPTPTPTPYSYIDPTAPPSPVMKMRGRNVETDAGWINDVPFSLAGSAVAPLSGLLRTTVAATYPLSFVAGADGSAGCSANPELTRRAELSFPSQCAGQPTCDRLDVRIYVEGGRWTQWDWGEPIAEWLFPGGEWLFRCDVKVDEAAFDGQYYLRVGETTFRGERVDVADVLIDTFVPWYSPTATPTSTPTPRPRFTPRPCIATENGGSIVCLSDTEAEPGGTADVSVHYRSGGVEQAGIELVIDAREPFVFPTPDPSAPAGEAYRGLCTFNPALEKNGSAFARSGSRIKILILSFENTDPLPDDVRLVTCSLDLPADAAPGVYEVAIVEPGGADPKGNALPVAARSGFIRVRGTIGAPTVTTTPRQPTPTPSSEPSPTSRSESREIDGGESSGRSSGCQLVDPAATGRDSELIVLIVGVLAVSLLRRLRMG